MSLCLFRSNRNFLKLFLTSLCLFRSIEAVFRSIETRESSFFKNSDLTCSNNFFKTFSNFFLSLRLGKAPLRFFVVFLHFSCKDSLSLSRYVYFALPFAFFFKFSCINSCIFVGFSELFKIGIFVESILFF